MTPAPNTPWRKLKLSYPSVFRNLAVEEALARTLSTGTQNKPTLRLWTNPRTVVVGRFQEAPAEADLRQCELNHVSVARRFTGGGTVFQDEATLNLTLVEKPQEGLASLKFQETNLQLVNEALRDLGLQCSASQNSILTDGRKVCGAAAAVGLHFALWHCSILVNTDTKLLETTLAPSKLPTKDRFVHSRWQEVTTLAAALSKPISLDEVVGSLERTIQAEMIAELETGQLSIEEEKCLEALYSSKYSSHEWNMHGNRPDYAAEPVEGLIRQLPCASAQRP